MPWVVGVDEAGYGPNLGPLAQTAVALMLPDDDPAGWAALAGVIRRTHEKPDARLLVDDSKKVYAGGAGFAKLERGVFAGLGYSRTTLGELVARIGLPGVAADLAAETWFVPGELLPADAGEPATLPGGGAWLNLVPAGRFNTVIAGGQSKAVVLGRGLIALLRAVDAALPAGEPVIAACDKHGGRNFYAPLIQDAFPDGWVVADRESAAESKYRVLNLGRELSLTFRPRADGDSAAVALASMLAKYAREVCMRQFNAFWASHVPGLTPTAGYPPDAKRFYAEIRPAMEALGLDEWHVWRAK